MININRVKIDSNNMELFDTLYENNAYIAIGCVENDIDSYVNKFLNEYEEGAPYCGGLKDDITLYHTVGKVINSKYNLHGDNAFKDDTGFAIIPLEYFKDVGKLAMFRICTNPQSMKWFDDFVDNNERREKENG